MSGYKAIDTPSYSHPPNLGALTYLGGGQFNPCSLVYQMGTLLPLTSPVYNGFTEGRMCSGNRMGSSPCPAGPH